MSVCVVCGDAAPGYLGWVLVSTSRSFRSGLLPRSRPRLLLRRSWIVSSLGSAGSASSVASVSGWSSLSSSFVSAASAVSGTSLPSSSAFSPSSLSASRLSYFLCSLIHLLTTSILDCWS